MRWSVWLNILLWTAVAAILLNTFAPRAFVLPKGPEEWCRLNLHRIELATEKYWVDGAGTCPVSLQALIQSGALASMPENPYDREHRAMPEVQPGQHVAGGVTYIPIYDTTAASGSPPVSCTLLVYGSRPNRRKGEWFKGGSYPDGVKDKIAWDYVLLVLDGGVPGKRSGPNP